MLGFFICDRLSSDLPRPEGALVLRQNQRSWYTALTRRFLTLLLPRVPLSLCQATDTRLLPVLRSLEKVETLSLRACKKLTDKSMREVAELRDLTSLDVSDTKISDEGIVAISRLPHLTSLDIFFNYHISVRGYESLGGMPALTHLDVSACFFNADACVYALSGLVGLRHLDMGGWSDRLSHRALDALSNFPYLTHLSLKDNKSLTAVEGMNALATLTTLQTLNLQDCPMVTNESLHMLNGLHQLQFLALGGGAKKRSSMLSSLEPLRALDSLRYVRLSYCKYMTDAGLSMLPKHVQVSWYGCDKIKGTYDGQG